MRRPRSRTSSRKTAQRIGKAVNLCPGETLVAFLPMPLQQQRMPACSLTPPPPTDQAWSSRHWAFALSAGSFPHSDCPNSLLCLPWHSYLLPTGTPPRLGPVPRTAWPSAAWGWSASSAAQRKAFVSPPAAWPPLLEQSMWVSHLRLQHTAGASVHPCSSPWASVLQPGDPAVASPAAGQSAVPAAVGTAAVGCPAGTAAAPSH
mmetsp:Transcript_80715/g.187387  ORF Transcript_80715/g.187387 Transcript_80715/m.187387 type:complete len:204 (-) Transcript_80715:93-704(-)